MSALSWRGVLGASTLFALSASLSLATDSSPPAAESAEPIVTRALEAAVHGDQAGCIRLLKQALERDPEHPLARWHAGFVKQQNQWMPWEAVTREAAADKRLAEYRALRDRRAGTPGGELILARWCRSHKLDAEAAFHFMNVAAFEPGNKEARQFLRGQGLVPGKQPSPAAREATAKERQDCRRDWAGPRVREWDKALQEGSPVVEQSMAETLAEAQDGTALEVLDAVLYERYRDARSAREQQLCQTLCLRWISVLAKGDEARTTWPLVRNAVFHPFADARTAAAEALKDRPKIAVAGMLLQLMRAPVEFACSIQVLPDGGLTYRQVFEADSPQGAVRLVNDFSRNVTLPEKAYDQRHARVPDPAAVEGGDQGIANGFATTEIRARQMVVAQAMRSQAQTLASVSRTRQNVDRANQLTGQWNQRIAEILRTATGKDFGPDPVKWQDWWESEVSKHYELETPEDQRRKYDPYYDRYGPEEEPVYTRYYYGEQPVYMTLPRPNFRPYIRPSCFPRGTKVWTKIGPLPIEEVKPGDSVLSQDSGTGELAFKPVVATTSRAPSDRIEIGLGSETIVTTRGHPFWVAGQGWTMAKNLKPGSYLHTASGPAVVDRVKETPAADAWYEYSYNLVVADFHTYFVGELKTLVHDNSPFVEHQGLLPGLAKK